MKKTEIWKKESELAGKSLERDEKLKDIKRQLDLLHYCVSELEKTLEEYKALEGELLTEWSGMVCNISVEGVEDDYGRE